ncbi:MAG: SPOR domain-containing protein [Betaproteobacteria bacterium]
MRALFLLLVAANLAFFAWWTYYAPTEAGRDPKPPAQQIEPQKLRILPPEGELARDAAKPAEAQKPPQKAVAPDAPPAACLEWGAFAVADAGRAELALGPLALGERLAQRRTDESAGWWVFIPPQGNRAGAQKKAVELKGLGIDDYFVVQDEGPTRWALSMGVFRTEDAAKGRLESLKAKGVRSAQIGARDTPVQKVWFQVRGANAAQQGMLRELNSGFPGTEIRDCQ